MVNNVKQIDLEPGEKFHFEGEVAAEKVRISSPYVGILRNKYILAELPVSKVGPLFQQADVRCTVRFLSRGAVYGFTSTVVAISHNPIPLVFIAFPSKIEKLNLRKEGRFKVCIPIMLGFEGSGDVSDQEGTVTDLSNSGCRVITHIFCDSGDKLALKMKIGDSGESETVMGIVRNSQPNGNENYELGIQFEKTYEQVESFINRLKSYVGVEAE